MKKEKQPRGAGNRKKKEVPPTGAMSFPEMRPDAAGIDIGAEEIWVAVPPDRDERSVRQFGSFTADLKRLIDWLEECQVQTVAMEATGVYWIPLYQMLADRKFEVTLVNARYYRNVAGRPTDAGDCQWLRHLHSVGLLKGSFRPEQAICAVRTLLRHRDNLIKAAAVLTQQMQKALDQMNIKLQYVLSDVLGVSGMAILDALIGGERDLEKLADLCHATVRASRGDIKKSLEGDYRPEHLFVLGQCLRMFRHQQDEITKLDQEMEKFMAALPDHDPDKEVTVEERYRKRVGKSRKKGGHSNAPAFDVAQHCARIAGVNLAAIPGVGVQTAHLILTELGPDLSAFPTAGDFCSWLCLCPHQQVTGGVVVSSRTRKTKSRVANALRVAANSLHHDASCLGNHLRKMKSRLGKAEGITATAHKLARIVYRMLKTKEPYDESILAEQDQRYQQKNLERLRRQAKDLGFSVVPLEVAPIPQTLPQDRTLISPLSFQ